MGEVARDRVEIPDTDVISALITNLETSLANARVLNDVLAEEHNVRRNLVIERIDSTQDLGESFVDEANSSRQLSYRTFMRFGESGGEAIFGNVIGLAEREVDGRPELQIHLDVGYENGPVACFFKLTDTLAGCRITRIGLGANQN